MQNMAEPQERLLLRQDKEQLDKEIAALGVEVKEVGAEMKEAVAKWENAGDAESKAFYSKLQERLAEQRMQLVSRQERLDEQRLHLQKQLAGRPSNALAKLCCVA